MCKLRLQYLLIFHLSRFLAVRAVIVYTAYFVVGDPSSAEILVCKILHHEALKVVRGDTFTRD